MTPSPHARARARRYAMQALYQWDMSGTATHDIRNQFLETEDFNTDREYFVELFNNITKLVEDIDNNLAQHLDIPLPRLDPVNAPSCASGPTSCCTAWTFRTGW